MTTTTQDVTPAASLSGHAQEVARGERFEFGQNWTRFLATVNDARVLRAEASLKAMLGLDTLAGLTFLDIGCGSGLFSLAARRLGADRTFVRLRSAVGSLQPQAEGALPSRRRRLAHRVGIGPRCRLSRKPSPFRHRLLLGCPSPHRCHVAGARACAASRAANGKLFIAIYNDMGSQSIRWRQLKRLYAKLPAAVQPLYACAVSAPEEAKGFLRAVPSGRPQDYVATWTKYERNRGMSRWRDIIDWVGGYPYEFAKPDAICSFFIDRGFALDKMCIGGGLGCSEYVFSRSNSQRAMSRW